MIDQTHEFDSCPEGLSELLFPQIERLGHRGSRIVYHAPELTVAKDPNTGLSMFKVDSVFGDTNSVLIGCGMPNLATSVYDDAAGTWKRLSGFMLYREPSRITEVNELQAGVYFELRGMSQQTRDGLLSAMVTFSGLRSRSCARLNSKMLHGAGFSLGNGRPLTGAVRPSRMASLIWRFGLQHDNKPVEMRVVNTSPIEVADHFVGVWRKEVNSPIRLVHKVLMPKRAKVPVEPLPAQPVGLRTKTEWSGRRVTVSMNRPTLAGWLLTVLWGRHAEYKVSGPDFFAVPELTTPLAPFPGPLSWVSKAKKHALFSRPVVGFINAIKNKSFDRYDNVPVDAAIEMMSPMSADRDEKVLWNFALVLTDGSYEVRLSPLKNLDALSRESKLRQVSNWILAKHVVATGYNANTVFAGEAWIELSNNRSDMTMYINDNSGTYKPKPEQLQSVVRLFSTLGLHVVGVPYACPVTQPVAISVA